MSMTAVKPPTVPKRKRTGGAKIIIRNAKAHTNDTELVEVSISAPASHFAVSTIQADSHLRRIGQNYATSGKSAG